MLKKILIILFFVTMLNSVWATQSKMEILEYFSLLPLSSFDNISDGLNAEEKELLIKNGKGKIWEVIKKNNSSLEIYNSGRKSKDSNVTLKLFSKNNSSPLLVCL
ncbi:MAG: hypothetical protein WCG27_02910 [Pseudomonadota bacterium]